MRNYSKAGGKIGLPGYRTPSSFQAKVFAVVRKIPKGKIMTYKQVAKEIGNPLAQRAVGNALNKNCDKDVPCHRVIRSDGKLGGYNNGAETKKKLLEKEGFLMKMKYE